VSTKEISEGLHVQRVLPSDEAGTTLALATSAKQDTAKEVLDAILAALASVPVTAAALPLPAGAATAAKQPAIGTAGTPSADVLSVQGRANMTPVAVNLARLDGTLVNPDADPDDYDGDYHDPGENTQATKTIASPGAGKRLVVTGIDAAMVADATAPTAVTRSVELVAGAAVIRSWRFALQAVAGDRCGITKACWIPLPLDTAVTLRWSSAGGAHTYQSVDLDVVTLSE
jgi:hypothetical protein